MNAFEAIQYKKARCIFEKKYQQCEKMGIP